MKIAVLLLSVWFCSSTIVFAHQIVPPTSPHIVNKNIDSIKQLYSLYEQPTDHSILVSKANEGDLNALYLLGMSHRYGLGVPVNKELAIPPLLKAAQKGHGYAQFALSELYRREYIINKSENIRWLVSAAKNEVPEAQRRLAAHIKYKFKQNKIASKTFINKHNLKSGDMKYWVKSSLLNFGDMMKGDTSPIALHNWAKTHRSYSNEALKGGATLAMLGNIEKLKALASKGNIEAQVALGDIYFYEKEDYDEARGWYTLAAKKGNAEATQTLWNLIMVHGPSDTAQRVEHLIKSQSWGAEYELPLALFNLADTYDNYYYKKTYNLNKSILYYMRAEKRGYKGAKNQLMFGVLRPVTKRYLSNKAPEDLKIIQYLSDEGYEEAQYELGEIIYHGKGVKRNTELAISLFEKSAKQGYYKAKDKLPLINCHLDSETILFEVKLQCADRNQLMTAVKQAGATVKSENKNHWGDSYDSSNILDGSNQLAILYTVDNYFAKATYTFPSDMDTKQVTRVRDFVSKKYGVPQYTKGKPTLGDVTYKWNLKDEIELKVYREWPNTTTYMSFIHPKNHQMMVTEQERQRKVRKEKKYESQSNAF